MRAAIGWERNGLSRCTQKLVVMGAVHIAFLSGFRNRFSVLFDWFWAYLTFRSGTRLITGNTGSFQTREIGRETFEAEAPSTNLSIAVEPHRDLS